MHNKQMKLENPARLTKNTVYALEIMNSMGYRALESFDLGENSYCSVYTGEF